MAEKQNKQFQKEFQDCWNGLTEDERKDVIRQLDEAERDLKDMLATAQPDLDRRLRDLAGPHLEKMLRTSEECLAYLSDSDPKLRHAAVLVASQHWNPCSLGSICERIAVSDPDTYVRDAAVRALGTRYAATRDARVGHLLSRFVRDDAFDEIIRLTAFCSLLRLHGNLDYFGPSPLVPTSLEQIDWAFVDEYYCRDTSEDQTP